MYGRMTLLAAAMSLLPLAAACGSSTPTIPTPDITTETFTGTINPHSADTKTFNTATGGPIVATLSSVAPVSTQLIGFAIGTWDGSACQLVIVNPAATTGSVVQANASTKGSYCFHVYDIGNITADAPVTYQIAVAHP